MQYGEEGFGELQHSREFDLLQARVCIDHLLSFIPLNSCHGWDLHSYYDLFGAQFPDNVNDYVFMSMSIIPKSARNSIRQHPGMLVYVQPQVGTLDKTSGQCSITPNNNPSKIGLLLYRDFRRTQYRYSRMHPIHEPDEMNIPVRLDETQHSEQRLTVDAAALGNLTDAELDKFLQFASPVVLSIIPIVSALN